MFLHTVKEKVENEVDRTKTGHEYVHTKLYCNLVWYNVTVTKLLSNYCSTKNEHNV